MVSRNRPIKPAGAGPAHKQHATRAREILDQPDPAGNPREMREMQLLKANAFATLALYELMKKDRRAAVPR